MPLSIYQGNDKAFTFTRGDINGHPITTIPQGIWFTVKSSYETIGFVFQKTLGAGINQNDDGSWNIQIDAEDTAELKTGEYVCDVKIQDEMGRQFTIVKPQKFIIADVSTRLGNQGG